MLKQFVASVIIFSFIGQISVPVFAQSKKKAASSSSKKSSPNKTRAASSKRASSRGASSKRVSSRSVSTSRALGRTSTTTSVSTAASNCLAQFIDCMDAQIDATISNYAYLADDAAVQAMQETGDPLRCVYYNASNVEGLFSSGAGTKYCDADLVSTRKDSLIDSNGKSVNGKNFNKFNVCSNQKDVNDLYLSYNYYCDLDSSDVGVAGMPINKCNLKESDGKNKNAVFATQDSYAYYNEANKRADAGELKIINFEQTALFKNKIEPLGLENWDKMSLTSNSTCSYVDSSGKSCSKGTDGCVEMCTNSVTDLMKDLGLQSTGKEIFSINVVPPIGAGNLDPGSQYEKARNICFGNTTFKTAGKSATESEKVVQGAISYLSSNCADPQMRTDLERYYIAGTAVKLCDDGYSYNASSDTCVNIKDSTDSKDAYTYSDFESGKTELTQTDFLSAKKSCDLYEQTLISTRNKAYADFDTKLKTYIDEQVASLIKNKSKSLSTIANALGSLQQTDAQISIDNIQREADILTSKTDAEIAKMDANTQLITKQLEASSKTISVQNEVKKLISDNFSKKISNACVFMAEEEISKKSSGSNITLSLTNSDLFTLTLKANAKGDIKATHTYSKDSSGVVDKQTYDKLDPNEYQEFDCNDVEGYDISSIIDNKITFGDCSDLQLSSAGTLPLGVYKLILKGAGGGGGAKAQTGLDAKGNGGKGGNGDMLTSVLLLAKSETYTLTVGKGGSGGKGKASLKANSGSDGGDTVLTIQGKSYTAKGGKGGKGGYGYTNGENGMSAGNGKGAGGGGAGSNGAAGPVGNQKRSGSKGDDGSAELQCIVSTK